MSYTSDSIFKNNNVNRFIDLLHYEIQKYLTGIESELEPNELIVLSGTVASILQEGPEDPIKNIAFVVIDEDLFAYLKLLPMPDAKRYAFKNKVVFETTDAIYEVHFFDETLNREPYESIALQLITDIPTDLL
jgi:hypothetical protein